MRVSPRDYRGKPMRVSVSRLSTFCHPGKQGSERGCQRKFFYTYLHEIRLSSPAAELGGRVHSCLEEYLKTGRVDPTRHEPEVMRIAGQGWHLLPPCDSYVEREITQDDLPPWLGGVLESLSFSLIGFVDCHARDGAWVLDHKTTGHPQFAKTPQELRWDWQINLYSAAILNLYRRPRLAASHIYYTTNMRGAFLRWTYISQQSADRALATFAGALHLLRTKLDQPDGNRAEAYEQNWDHCWAYGGCPFLAICKEKVSVEEFIADREAADSLLTAIGALNG